MSLWKFVCSVLLCSSVRKRKHLRVVGRFFSHRAHRVHGGFWRTFRAHRTPPAYRVHRALLLKVAVRFCEIGWLNVSVKVCVLCSSVFSVRERTFLRLAGEFYLSQSAQSSRSFLAHCFEPTEGLRHTENTERFSFRWGERCERQGSVEWWNILTTHHTKHPHNSQIVSSTIEDITHNKSACYVLRSSICPSCS